MLLQYTKEHPDQTVRLFELEVATGIKRHVWTYNMKDEINRINREMQKVETAGTGISLPSAEQIFTSCKGNEEKLAAQIQTLIEMVQDLAACMNFFLALRVGEIVALKTTDFSADSVRITRQEVKEYHVDADGRRHRLGYSISPYPKSPAGNRTLYLSKGARKYYHMILEHNRRNGLESEYLLLDKHGERLHDHAVNNVLRRVNRQIGTPQKGSHSIRKTCISNMIASKQLTNEEIRKFAGHEDFATTERYYEFATKSIGERTEAFEAALG